MTISTPMKRILTATLLGAASLVAWAQADTRPGTALETPALPPPGYAGETVQPDVTILETDRGTVYEYRINGQLYMVRIQPQFGPPYFLLDSDGDGTLDVQRDRVSDISIPQWVLFSW
jgi:hypothetical protein